MLVKSIGIVVLVFVVLATIVLGVVYGPTLMGRTAGVTAPPSQPADSPDGANSSEPASSSESVSESASASAPNSPYVTVEQYQKDREADLRLIDGNTQAIALNQKAIEARAEEIALNQRTILDNSQLIEAVRTQSNDVLAVQDDLNNTLQQIAARDASGAPFPNVLSIMASPDGREQMADAVHDSMRDRGTLIVENRMLLGYTLMVNGASHYVPAQQTVRVEGLPVGTIATELVGHESPKNWSLAPPNYEQRITIGRRPPRTVYYDGPVVQSPYYLDTTTVYYPPVWVW